MPILQTETGGDNAVNETKPSTSTDTILGGQISTKFDDHSDPLIGIWGHLQHEKSGIHPDKFPNTYFYYTVLIFDFVLEIQSNCTLLIQEIKNGARLSVSRLLNGIGVLKRSSRFWLQNESNQTKNILFRK